MAKKLLPQQLFDETDFFTRPMRADGPARRAVSHGGSRRQCCAPRTVARIVIDRRRGILPSGLDGCRQSTHLSLKSGSELDVWLESVADRDR